LYEGNFIDAQQQFDQASNLTSVASAQRHLRALDWRIQSRYFAAIALWILGYPKNAMSKCSEAFAIAHELNARPVDVSLAKWYFAMLNLLLRDGQTAYLFADEANRLVIEHNYPNQAWSLQLRGWARAQLGEIEHGLDEMLRYKAELMQSGVVFATWFFAGISAGYLSAGRAAEGLQEIEQGLKLGERGSRFLKAELLRLKGELLLIGGNREPEAARCFREAIEIARRQSAKSWELRATMSLARLLAKQGRGDEARTMLADIYGWFAEGFDTADLKDAKALLDELTG